MSLIEAAHERNHRLADVVQRNLEMKTMSREKCNETDAQISVIAAEMPFANRFAARTCIGDMVLLGTRHLVRQLLCDVKDRRSDAAPSGHYVH